ncbi:hypothetical protein [Wolbachia endosymbiont of Nilaparvata lugens]|uniref:hypothetical protein n=1 Tax=Wolbachia endosymbiont of Nilaparvata lugens TaxID=357143 RepID=UPI001F4FBA26|nr:hypothetical protein [Wolbachia endosymbiont of Nilaparvata lugens]
MKSFKWLLNQVRLSWISLISKVKSFFQTNDTHHQTTASNGNDHTRKISVENTIEAKGDEIDLEDEQDVFEDALTGEELDEEEFFMLLKVLMNRKLMLVEKKRNMKKISTTVYKIVYKKKMNLIMQRILLHLLSKLKVHCQTLTLVNLNCASLSKMVVNSHLL